MAIQYVGGVSVARNGNSNATTTQSLTSLTGGIATQPAEGDFVVVVCVSGSQGRNPDASISGYSTLGTQLNATAVTYDTSLQVSYKKMTSSPDTSITIPAQGAATDAQAWAVMVFRGVNAATPFDVSSVSATGTATGRFDAAAITPSTPGAWVVIAGGGAAAAGATYTAPTGFTDDWLTSQGADTNDAMVGMGYYTGWTSGEYNPDAVTGGTTGANDSWAAWTMALRPAKIADTGSSTETDAASAESRKKIRATGSGLETDSASAQARTHVRSTGLSQETDSASALTGSLVGGVQAGVYPPLFFYWGKAVTGGVPLGRGDETDSASALAKSKQKALGLSTETDTAYALRVTRPLATGSSTETDTASALARVKAKVTSNALETDSASGLTRLKKKTASSAQETDTASALARKHSKSTGQATETDAASALTRTHKKATGQATETDLASALAQGTRAPVGQASETDTASARGRVKDKSAGSSAETDAASAQARKKIKQCGTALESDLSSALARIKIKACGTATESDVGYGLNRAIVLSLGLAQETDTASSRAYTRVRATGSSTETDTAYALESAGGIVIVDNAGKIDRLQQYLISTAKGAVILYPKDGGYYSIGS